MSGLRDELAEALPHEDWCLKIDRHPDFPCPCWDTRYDRAENLPAVVERYGQQQRAEGVEAGRGDMEALERRWRAEGAAEALEGTAQAILSSRFEKLRAREVEMWLRDRAAAIRAQADDRA